MNAAERLVGELTKQFPDARVTLDRPDDPNGGWFVDVHQTKPARAVVVEWRPKHGFGVSTPSGEATYGTGPDEIYTTYRAALERVSGLLANGGATKATPNHLLAQLRTRCGISQTELAERLGLSQATVAQMERRNDFLFSTIVRAAQVMGVELTIQVKLPSGETRAIGV